MLKAVPVSVDVARIGRAAAQTANPEMVTIVQTYPPIRSIAADVITPAQQEPRVPTVAAPEGVRQV
jgi:hypothetical protein